MNKRYKHILVPLDSSELAELALVDAFDLAESNQAEVTLLRVTSPIEEVLAAGTDHPIFVDQQWEAQKAMALKYLDKVSERMAGKNVTIHNAAEMGLVAETIIDYVNQHPIDLIVMATHGRSGLQRWVYGSVAEKVLRGADVPVLLVRAHAKRSTLSDRAMMMG